MTTLSFQYHFLSFPVVRTMNRTMTNVNQAPLPQLSKVPLVRASLVKRRYIKYLALPFFFAYRVQAFVFIFIFIFVRF